MRVLVESLSTTVDEVLLDTINGSQQVLNSLPFTNKNPQVRDYSPKYVSGKGDVHVTVRGNFSWAMQTKTAVRLRLGTTTYEPMESTTAQVGFLLPVGAIAGSADRLAAVSLELTAPYEKGMVFKSIQPGTFRLMLTALPLVPLKALVLHNSTTVTGTETRTQTQPASVDMGAGWRVQSWGSCQPAEDSHSFSATSGWKIVPASVQVHYLARGEAARGAASVLSASPTGFVVQGKTSPNCFLGISDNSGDITYYVMYDEARSTTTTSDSAIDLLAEPYGGLSWGDQMIVPVTQGGWSINATLWDGTRIAIGGSDERNAYLKVNDLSDQVRIALVTPAV